MLRERNKSSVLRLWLCLEFCANRLLCLAGVSWDNCSQKRSLTKLRTISNETELLNSMFIKCPYSSGTGRIGTEGAEVSMFSLVSWLISSWVRNEILILVSWNPGCSVIPPQHRLSPLECSRDFFRAPGHSRAVAGGQEGSFGHQKWHSTPVFREIERGRDVEGW